MGSWVETLGDILVLTWTHIATKKLQKTTKSYKKATKSYKKLQKVINNYKKVQKTTTTTIFIIFACFSLEWKGPVKKKQKKMK